MKVLKVRPGLCNAVGYVTAITKNSMFSLLYRTRALTFNIEKDAVQAVRDAGYCMVFFIIEEV